jgi:hypothetical protein
MRDVGSEKDGDLTLTCRECGQPFVFTRAEQEFYQQKNFTQPQRCKACRIARNTPRPPVICLKCGGDIGEGGPTYCATCFENAQLEFEIKAKGFQRTIKKASDELQAIEVEKEMLAADAEAKLNALESDKSRLADEAAEKISAVENEKAQLIGTIESKLKDVELEKDRLAGQLEQQKQARAGIQEQLDKVNVELDKALRYRAALDWLEPVLKGIKQEMEMLKLDQSSLHQAVLQLTSTFGEDHENGSWVKAFLRFFQPHHKSPASDCQQ